MARKRKVRLKKAGLLTHDEVLQILVSRYVRVNNIEISQLQEVPKIEQEVFDSIAEYKVLEKKVIQVREKNQLLKKKHDRKKKLSEVIKSQIGKIIPYYKWFVVTVKHEQYAVGCSTSDWGGGDLSVFIKKYPGDKPLHKLKHITVS